MSTAVMMERIAGTSPRLKARIAGVFYLLTTLTRMFVEIFVRNRLVVFDDAARRERTTMGGAGQRSGGITVAAPEGQNRRRIATPFLA